MDMYADEDVARLVVTNLRQYHDVSSPRDHGTTSRSDAWHLHQATRQDRLFLTVNHNDYRFLHRVLTTNVMFGAMPASHAGILCVFHRPEAEDWAAAIHNFVRSTASLAGRLFVWQPVDKEWRQDQWRPES